jgi:hypothetical protein
LPVDKTGLGGATGGYLLRQLRFTDSKGDRRQVDESEMLATKAPKIVLGEPGMGKSELMREAGRRLEVTPITAVRFMFSKDPAQFVLPGKPLIIDGLDEAMARREGDAVDMILAQLEAAGSPEFILSCRTREWQARNVTNLRQIYGADPSVFVLEPLSQMEARTFLVQRFANADADHVLDHLDKHRLAELYQNPLTLGLMGRVAEYDTHLPLTRAALFERVCTLIWPEHDPDRQDSGLGHITADSALSAAGAIMAGLLFAGAEAASVTGPLNVQDSDVRLVDFETLPGAEAVRAILASKLFQSVGVGRAKPLHRVIAEYLGARWLAQKATTPRAHRRLLAQLHGSGGVPASLRGLHAWLAFQSSAMAEQVIAADPFGVLRYGETANLTAAQADCMFDALCSLAEVDPFFRAQDWDSHTVAALMIPRLRDKIDSIIGSAESNEHLRSLLIEGLEQTALAADLRATLEAVLLSGERFYRERDAAAKALLPHHDRTWWRQAIDDLWKQGTADSTGLAGTLIERIDCDVSDELLVETVFAEIGVTISPLPRAKNRRTHRVRSYSRIINSLPASRLVSVLNLVADHATLADRADWEPRYDIVNLTSGLMLRAISEKAVGPSDAAALYHWLGVLELSESVAGEKTKDIRARLQERDDLRRAIQYHVLYAARPHPTIWASELELSRRMVGLVGQAKDVTWFLERLGGEDNKNPALRQDWCDLMRLGMGPDGFDPCLRATSQKFQRGDAQLEAFVRKLENPKKPGWQRRQEREAAKEKKKRQIAIETARRAYAAERAALRAGKLAAILKPAKAYLGHFRDLTRDQPPADRIAEWLGSDLRNDAMVGLEAVLHRADLPTPVEITKGFAEGRTWNYCFAIMAGLLERQRAGKGFSDLTPKVRTTGLLLCHDDRGMCVDDNLPALREALEAIVIPTAKDREDFARLWIEPSLAAGCSHVSGLHMLAYDEKWQPTGATLAGDWLMSYPNLPENIELELADCLTHSGALATLASTAATRASAVFRNFDHMLAWLAIDVLVRFDAVLKDLAGIGAQNPEFIWFLRNRLQLERRGSMLPLSPSQVKWIVSEFRAQWPYAVLHGTSSGDTNPFDATDFLRALINRIADDTTAEASDAMQALIADPVDSYSELIRHMAAEQRQKRAEEDFAPLLPKSLAELLMEGPPSNADDLKALVVEELAVAQKKLVGDDLDQIRDFWNDTGVPYDENRCRDRLAALISPELTHYGVLRITEADMPKTKRADLAFAHGQLQLPMEVKGQWHKDVWDAATGQLDLQYLIDWRSDQRGIYCVLWCGDLPSKSGRRLKAPPEGLKTPKKPDEMHEMLIARIPESRQPLIDVVVLDLTVGKS